MNKKNWLLFYMIITIIGTAVLATTIYMRYQNLINEEKAEQIYATKSFHNHLQSLFSNYEIIHNLIADQYLQNKFNSAILNTVITQNDLLYNMAIFSIEGELLTNDDGSTTVKKNALWHSKAINNAAIVIGEVYFEPQANKWLIPLYKRIEDSKSAVKGVFVSALDVEILNQQWGEKPNHHNIQATLANGLMPIFRSNLPLSEYTQYYSKVAINDTSKHLVKFNIKAYLSDIYTMAETQTQQVTIDNIEVITTVIFNTRYQFWVSTHTPILQIKAHMFYHAVYYTLFYLLGIALIWGLVRWVIQVEESQIATLTYKNEHDALTGLFNSNTLETYYKKAKSKNSVFSLLYLDLDKFKSINDSFGHSYGDDILVEVSQRIKKVIEHYDGTAIRYSGDEFVLLVNSDSKELLQHCATHLLDTVSQPYLIGQNAFKLTSSIGIACYPEDAENIETLLSYADHSMYVAKQTKTTCLFFSKSTHRQLTRRVEIEQALHHAIERQEISIVYQPQVNASNTLLGVEALVRWHSDDLGTIPPDTFIPIAEENGMMPQLGLYIMHQAIQEITQLQQTINQHFTLSINVSVRQFIQINFIEKFLDILNKHTNSNHHLAISIEITESLFIESIESLLPLFHKLKHHRITLSLDDFGTGYSSLSLLRDVPIDELKIDKSFVDHITTNRIDKAMVESIISMGKKLELSVLAEGVETKQQADILLAAGCDLFQGYLFSKPLTIGNLKKYCLQQSIEK